jgi:hypothetical protein
MNPKYNIYEEIDRYLNHELSEQELIDFNLKLENDAELQELVEAQQMANEIIIDHELIKLKERMSKDLNKGNSGLSSHWGKLIVLTIAVGSTAIYSYYQFNNKTNNILQSTNATAQKSTAEQPNQRAIEVSNIAVKTAPVKKESASANDNKVAINNEEQNSEAITTQSLFNSPKEISKNTTAEVQANTANSTKNSVQPDVTEIKAVVTKPCEFAKIVGEATVQYGFNDATIIVNSKSIKGGTPPYTFALNAGTFEHENKFTDLKDGVYSVSVKDKNSCVSTIQNNIVVRLPAQPIDEAFTPAYGEHWKFPLGNETEASITIINKVGRTVYSTSISGGYPSDWDGRGNDGAELDLGNYYFILTFKNNTVTKGNVSIIK